MRTRSQIHARPTRGSLLALCLGTLAAGCAGSGNQAAAPTPSSATPGLVAFTVSDFTDTNLNGYRDTTSAAVYIMAHGYPIPMRAAGSVQFKLYSRDAQPLATWSFTEQQAAQAQYDLAPGPGYIFDLSLLALGSDQLEVTEGELICTFTPTGGQPIRARPSGPIQVGRLVTRSSGRSSR